MTLGRKGTLNIKFEEKYIELVPKTSCRRKIYIISKNYKKNHTYNLCFYIYYLDVLNSGIQNTVENIPVFDPDFHTELIIKDEYEDYDSGIAKTIKLRVQSF